MPRMRPVTNDAASEHEEDGRPGQVVGLAHAPERDPVDDARLERWVVEQHRDLRGVDDVGMMALTLMPCCAHSVAHWRVRS